jgi:cytochrome P450
MRKTGEDLLDDIVAEDVKHASTVQFTAFDQNSILLTIEPANLQAMLAVQFSDFELGKCVSPNATLYGKRVTDFDLARYDTFGPVTGRSIFTSDGAFWEHSRGLFRAQFARENINDLEMTDKAATELITAMGDVDAEGWTTGTQMLPLVQNFTLDTASDFLFGKSLESQQVLIAKRTGDNRFLEASRANQAFADAFETANYYMILRIRLQSLYWLGDSFAFRRAIKGIRQYIQPLVQRAVNAGISPVQSEDKKQSLINNLATQTHDHTELVNQSLSILLAGRDTTASMVAWSICELSLHPDIFSKLRESVFKELPPEEEITFSKLKSCRYLRHFLQEVLRLHPSVPVNQRHAAKDTTLPVG